jgi:hypothetical protein
MPAQRAASDSVLGAETYPYDPTLRLESQHGLDRLRCVADRALAADFFAIYQATERNTEAAIVAAREQAERDEAERRRLAVLADRALAGEFGSDEKKLAAHVLLDERGRCATDLRALREFRRALIQLKRER